MSIVVPLLLLLVFARAIATKTNVYHSFVEGAKQGLPLAKSLLPYLACMLIAVELAKALEAGEDVTKMPFLISTAYADPLVTCVCYVYDTLVCVSYG